MSYGTERAREIHNGKLQPSQEGGGPDALTEILDATRSLLESGAVVLENNAELLDHLVMDTPEDQGISDRMVELTRSCASNFRSSLAKITAGEE